MVPLLLERVNIRDVRNLREIELRPARRVTVISGSNGQGKTSILEAIYLSATSRSFRTAKLTEVVAHNASSSNIRSIFRDGSSSLPREQLISFGTGRRLVQIDKKRPTTLAAFATKSPIVCFHAQELELSMGPAAGRRTVLDRVALFVDAASADHRARYQEALKSRQRALEISGTNSADVDAYEQLCVEYGVRLTLSRKKAADVLIPALLAAFRSIADPSLNLVANYCPGGSSDQSIMRDELFRRRQTDRLRGSASFGPQKDDLTLVLDDHNARTTASQGQHRAITLSIKLAEVRAIAASSGKFPLLLLDDVSSELDRDRMISLLNTVTSSGGQVIITTTRPELIETPGVPDSDRSDIRMESGKIVQIVS